MRLSRAILVAAAAGILCATLARANHQPAIVVPGNTSAPVIINGQDASWSVVEGDWGLYRPGEMPVTVYYPYLPPAYCAPAYYPFTGKRPKSGRLEVIPPANRRLPPQAESFHRYWSNDGPMVPAQTDYPQLPPPVIVAPRVRGYN